MRVMPANASGWFWHCLARETGRIGHLYSPGAQRGPWQWFPYALDNGAYSAWVKSKPFDWEAWRKLIMWAQTNAQAPIWAIVPDVVADREQTLQQYEAHVDELGSIPPAIAVQDGMTDLDIINLKATPQMICIGGTTEWQWETVPYWVDRFRGRRVHVLRVNSPSKLEYLERLGVASCDGTGWNRGSLAQTEGLERFLRSSSTLKGMPWLYPYVCRNAVKGTGQGALL